MRPSAATRLAFLSALARPDLRSASAAASMSPLFSVRAFLHSIMPAPVRSRSSLTMDAVISVGDLEFERYGRRARARCMTHGGGGSPPAAVAAAPRWRGRVAGGSAGGGGLVGLGHGAFGGGAGFGGGGFGGGAGFGGGGFGRSGLGGGGLLRRSPARGLRLVAAE